MIGRLHGSIVDRDGLNGLCVVDVQGVGYEVSVPVRSLPDLATPPQPATLHIHTHVREEALTLFGFVSLEDRSLFRSLTAVSGVGPKLAMAILSDMTGAVLCTAVAKADKKRFSAVTGVGAKLAARLTLELRDKVPLPSAVGGELADFTAAPTDKLAPPQTVAEEVVQALMSLGFQRNQAESAVAAIVKANEARSVEVLLRLSLAQLG